MEAALFAHLWQSTLFACAAWALTSALRRYSARTRYLIWLAASVKFLVPFSALTALGLLLRPAGTVEIEFIPAPLMSAALSIAEPATARGMPLSGITSVIVSLWAVGCAAILARWLVCWLITRAVVHAAANYPTALLHRELAFGSRTYDQWPADIKVSADFTEPGVFGIREPVLLLPEEVVSRMSRPELTAVIAHEMCHVRHKDNLAAAVHMFIQAVFWFHPVTWWIGKRLLEERERACDEAVIELGAPRRTYAEGILKACRASIESRLGVVAGAAGANLRQRIEDIVSHQPSKRLGAIGKVSLIALASAMLALPLSAGLATPRAMGLDMPFGDSAPRRFDSSSIMLSMPRERGAARLAFRAGRLSMKDTSLRKLVSVAFGVGERRVLGGPEWMDRHYDIEANASQVSESSFEDVSGVQRQLILALLADEFKLKFVEIGKSGGMVEFGAAVLNAAR